MAEAQEEEEEGHQTMTEPPYPFSSFLRRGLRIGRRVAIAGAAMAAAPVVIPTIVMGAAFAFPFGVYLAGFAFTDRVMRSLLSISSSQNIGISEMGKVGILKKNEEELDPIVNYHQYEDHREHEEVECDEPTLTTAEHKISMWTDIPIEEGNSFGGTGIGEETHVEEATDRDLDNCDPEQVTKINFMHASSTGNKEDTLKNIGMEEKERQIPAEIRAEENEERGERDKTDKENTNEKLKIWSLDNSPNGCTNTKGVGKPLEATEKAEKDEMKEEMEIQGLSTVVSEVKQFPMTSHPFDFVMSKGNNDEKDLTIFSSKQPAADKGDEMRVEEVKQPEIMLVGRYSGEEDKEQDVNEKVNREEGSYVFATLPASVEGESVVKQPSAEWSRYEGVEILGSTLASGIVVEAAMRQRNAEDSGSALIPHIEDMTVCHSSVSAVPLPCENEMAPSRLWKEYACVVEDYSSDRTGVESGPASTVVEIAGVVYFHDEDPRVQEEVERDKPALVTAVNEIEICPRTIKLNTPREERGNTDGMRIIEERCIEEAGASELNYHDIEQDTKISFKFASSIDSIIPDIGMVDGTTNAEVGFENNEDAEGIEEMEDEKAGVNEEQKIGCSDYPSNVNDYRRGFINMETGDGAAELPGNGIVDEKKAEQEMKIESLTTAVPEVKHHPEMTSPFAAVMPDTETEGRILSSSSSFVVEKGNERRMQEVKQPELMFLGRGGRMEDEVHDVPSAAVETKEVLPTVRRSLTAVPEEWEIDFKLPGLGSVHAFSAVTNKEVEGKPMKEANEEKVREQEDIDLTHRNYVIASVVSVECKSMVEQFSVEQNIIDKNVEDGICAATTSIEQTGVRHSFVDAVLLENESEMAPSSLSTEYASAVEDHSSYVTDAESAPAVTVSETAGIVLFQDEVSYNEETIWQQMCAMRTIVGYEATPHSSLVGELKALYLFTGVEPPISLNETSDVMEISDKLKLLKSVVGVE